MLQVFRLVQPGLVDKVIAFDELPQDLIDGIKTRPPDGLPRHWREFAPSFFVLDYITTNNDKEKWAKISNYVRRNVNRSVRLLDKLEDMAQPMAPDAKQALTLEPEEVPVLTVEDVPTLPQEELVEAPRRGRPRKNVEA